MKLIQVTDTLWLPKSRLAAITVKGTSLVLHFRGRFSYELPGESELLSDFLNVMGIDKHHSLICKLNSNAKHLILNPNPFAPPEEQFIADPNAWVGDTIPT